MSGCAQGVCRDGAVIVAGTHRHQRTASQIGNAGEGFGME
jgi:hypothetical protein